MSVQRPSRAHLRSAIAPDNHTPTHSVSPSRTVVSRDTSRPPPQPHPPAPAAAPAPVVSNTGPPRSRLQVHRDIRTYLPTSLLRFTGYKQPTKPPLPFPPFSWLSRIPLKYEVWLLSLIGSFVGIALIEMVMIGLSSQEVIMIVASFGASAVLTFGTVESPLAQPRHLVGGHLVSAIVGVALTRLFRLSGAYELHDTTRRGDLGHVVWLNGALSMAVALLAQQITGTVHPPGGATALIASVQPAAVHMSWEFIYVVLISSLVMLAWALIINNVGRRRYPTYWMHGEKVYVREKVEITQDELQMEAEEGRVGGFAAMERAFSDASLRQQEKATRPMSLEKKEGRENT